MLRFITPIILTTIAIIGFFVFANPIYKNISVLNTAVASRNEALDNSKALEGERDKLTAQYNAITPDNLDRLQKLLPDTIDNIRLILEISGIAAPYGMTLKDVKYDTTNETTTPASAPTSAPGAAGQASSNQDYGTWNLEFSTTGSYDNFLNFTKDLENNLRIVDISSIDFSSDVNATATTSQSSDTYTYDFKIKTYWLKN